MLRYETGDAAGQNMTTVVSWQVAKWANEMAQKELGITIKNFQIDGVCSIFVLLQKMNLYMYIYLYMYSHVHVHTTFLFLL